MQGRSFQNQGADRNPRPIPVTIVGGFLGAGKTTLLNTILSKQQGLRAAVLVNDFGVINIDAKLIVSIEANTIALANGCICCNIRGDSIASCLKVLQQPDPPDYLLVETSGISDLLEVANTFLLAELQPLLFLNSLLTVIDAEQFPLLQGESSALAKRQLQTADLVVINKVDLVDATQLVTVKSLIQSVAPGSRILEASHGNVPLPILLGEGRRKSMVWPPTTLPVEIGADLNHGFSTWHWTCDRSLSLAKLRAALEQLPETIYRVKGILYLEELPAYRFTLQMVGRRFNINDLDPWDSEQPQTTIVAIGDRQELSSHAMQKVLQTTFENCVRQPTEAMSPTLRLARKLGL